MPSLSIGDEAPNFDLSSTEDAVLMLRDEVARTSVVVYFFADPTNAGAHRDLDALSQHLDRLARLRARVLAVSPAPLDALKKLQAGRKLLFPLLHDDRSFSAAYGVTGDPALVVVSRKQRILWLANPVDAVAEALPQVEKALEKEPSPAKSYPKSVINKLVDKIVN
ncbi:MAG TPA: redoxin domain-containing protein [Thermoanaerobaculia bacterium]|nr:redoxin domain-containing protein [Thermoanaerobaculia bacterium]